ncbi:crcB protein [Bacillus cereus MSX-A1]|uniref:CrcB family protein n=1 Tax=Bacillus cereus TaxID=1396 RepID=UPI000279580A|nr:CrcB family protein [Bacillus cereus]EJQ99026.1 crcB protein [Bacillus cereus MSX-A1]MDR4291038.1 fluoride efflux transporter CrcB [Bacillus cereus]
MEYIVVGLFGIIGALSRYQFGLTIDKYWHQPFPLATLLINLIGCCLLGWLTTYISRLNILRKEILTGIGTGFLGAFTTFSTFKLEAIQLGTNKKWFHFILYLGATYTIGILFAFVGMYVGKL